MTEQELAWLAGLLEGEGSFCKGPPSSPNTPSVSVNMTDRDVMERARLLMGAPSLWPVTAQKPHHTPSFRTQVRGAKAIALMRQLLPLMGQRRQIQIRAAIASWQPVDPGVWNRRKLPCDNAYLARLHRRGLSFRDIGWLVGLNHESVAERIRGRGRLDMHSVVSRDEAGS